MTVELVRGFVAGVYGVLAMAGAGFTVRRVVQPSGQIGKTHYESVVEWSQHLLAPEATPLEADTRVRVGEATHFIFGGLWGMVIAGSTRGTVLRPLRQGTRAGVGIWLLAFAGYMPALGISRPLWKMSPHEFTRTLVSHLAFAVTTFVALESLRASKGTGYAERAG